MCTHSPFDHAARNRIGPENPGPGNKDQSMTRLAALPDHPTATVSELQFGTIGLLFNVER
jgi:hypothetical protein